MTRTGDSLLKNTKKKKKDAHSLLGVKKKKKLGRNLHIQISRSADFIASASFLSKAKAGILKALFLLFFL